MPARVTRHHFATLTILHAFLVLSCAWLCMWCCAVLGCAVWFQTEGSNVQHCREWTLHSMETAFLTCSTPTPAGSAMSSWISLGSTLPLFKLLAVRLSCKATYSRMQPLRCLLLVQPTFIAFQFVESEFVRSEFVSSLPLLVAIGHFRQTSQVFQTF